MNINDYQRPKSKSQFKLSKSLIEKKEKEIKTSLRKDVFLSKKKTFNKSKLDFISKQQQIIKAEPKEKKENKINQERPFTNKIIMKTKNFNNSQSFHSQIKENSPKIVKTTKSFNFNHHSKLFLNTGKEFKKDEKAKEQILPKLSNQDKPKNSEKNISDNENNKNNKTKHLFYSFRNNIKILDKKTESQEKKNLNLSKNMALFKIKTNINEPNNEKQFSYYKKYKYIIRPENCGYLIKNCFKHRINWVELPDLLQKDFNFKWQQNTRNLNFSTLSKVGHFKQMTNHYEYHSVITNKANLFLNLMKHAEIEEENVFKYLPFTVIFEYGSDNFFLMMDNFEKLFNNIEKYLVPMDDMDASRYKYFKNRIYYNLFPFEDHLGVKTAINIPTTHMNINYKNINDKSNKKEDEKNSKFMNKNLWLVKAPDLNRGMCIQIVDNVNLIKKHIYNYYRGIDKRYSNSNLSKNRNSNASYSDDIYNYNVGSSCKNEIYESTENVYHKYRSTLIVVQKYIERPLLYFGRKFDIRIWVLLTHDFKVYMFNEGHLKCCSVKYDLDVGDSFSHLTNYSFQKYNNNFGKYEKGNEVSFDDLQYNIEVNYNNKMNFKSEIIPKIKHIIKFVFQSVKTKINGLNRNYTFEIYGFDFMLDIDFNPFLIEVNLNPGLEESSPLIKMLVPRMLDDALRLTVDKEFNTVYSFKGIERRSSESDYIYESPFPVNGYSNNENLFNFICDLNLEEGTNKKITKFRHLRIKTNKNQNSNKFF